MSIAAMIQLKIQSFGEGQIFSYTDFAEVGNFQAVASVLSRLNKGGKISRLSKGQYYVPKQTRFGALMPSENQILEKLLQQNGGYVAGISALNRMGVTTQVPSEVLISGARSSRRLQIGNLRVKFVKGRDEITSFMSPKLIDILETLRLFKKIPNGNLDQIIVRLKSSLTSLDQAEIQDLVTLALNYRASVRAVLGALFQNLGIASWEKLKQSLNPISTYKLGIPALLLPNRIDWKIQ